VSIDQSKREQQAMREVTVRLTKAFAARPAEQVTQTVEAIGHRFDGRPIRDFIPVLVERYAYQELSGRPAVIA
jgi:hypothetical protein